MKQKKATDFEFVMGGCLQAGKRQRLCQACLVELGLYDYADLDPKAKLCDRCAWEKKRNDKLERQLDERGIHGKKRMQIYSLLGGIR